MLNEKRIAKPSPAPTGAVRTESADSISELCRLIDEAGLTVTFSANCRSGLIGDLCRCWRCSWDPPDQEHPEAHRDALAADRAYGAGLGLGGMVQMIRRVPRA